MLLRPWFPTITGWWVAVAAGSMAAASACSAMISDRGDGRFAVIVAQVFNDAGIPGRFGGGI